MRDQTQFLKNNPTLGNSQTQIHPSDQQTEEQDYFRYAEVWMDRRWSAYSQTQSTNLSMSDSDMKSGGDSFCRRLVTMMLLSIR